jgi:hypothetical protein
MAAALLAALLGGAGEAKQSGREGAGGRTMAHNAGGKRAGKGQGSARLFRLNNAAAEPTLGLTKEGTVFYTAADINRLNRVDIFKSTDGAASWENVSPAIGGRNIHAVTLDPYIWVDPWTDRVYTIDLTVACSLLSYTDDGGKTWVTNPLACGRPVNDHQTLFGGPPATTSPVLYENILYYCWNDIATSSCSKSTDGGLTFHPTGSPAFTGVSTGEGQGNSGQLCGGLHGHGVVGEDGTIYLPREYCNQPWLAISTDEGVTWSRVRVADLPASGGPDPSVAVDKKGNIYYIFTSDDRLPYLVTSRDGGKSWSRPVMIAAPGVNETNLATIDAGKPGAVAIAYMGTTNSPGDPWEGNLYAGTTWNAYVTVSTNAFARSPRFTSATINDPKDPVFRRNCGPGRCGAVFDFIDVVIGPDGRPYGAFVDGCMDVCATPGGVANFGSEGLVGTIAGGPRLR